MMARGPGWRLAEGEGGSWWVKLCRCDDAVSTWAHMLRTLQSIADTRGLRPLIVDLGDGERLAGPAAEAAARVFAMFEDRGLRVATVVGPDLIHAIRLHRMMGTHATVHGRCFLTADEAREWIRRSPPPVAPPLCSARGGRRPPPRV